ncbi:MAG TPA: hypothetical protein DD490_16315 [Acidobacteria bacterium]|nr:hypothetical protein [Acidobacteriota bacterium]
MSAGSVPFVIGQWVSGPRFYGREAEIAELLEGPRRRSWIVGLRRIGKTSLLKQLDHLAGRDGRCLPVFWDLQGVAGVADLGLSFTDALLDAEESLERCGIALPEVEDPDLFTSLARLADALERSGATLLLLCDEADELAGLDAAAPGLPGRLWQALEVFPAARVVLASSPRLTLGEPFAPPLYLGGLTEDAARALVRQSRLPDGAPRPAFDDAGVERVRTACGDHPMLLQMAAKRWHELGDLDEALRQLAADRTVQHLLAVDFDLLTAAEQAWLRALAQEPGAAAPDGAGRLPALGLVRPGGPAGWRLAHPLLAAWLRR